MALESDFPGRLALFVEWTSGMDAEYWHAPSQHCDPLRAMEEQCRWQCTQPRQNLRNSFDKTRYYKPNRFYGDSGMARQMDASRYRDRTFERFCNVLWRKPKAPSPRISLTPRHVHRLLERLGLDEAYLSGGLPAIARLVGMTRRQREAFVLWPHLSQEEIADKLGITQEAVSQRLSNAVKRCRAWTARTRNLIPLPLSISRDFSLPTAI